MPYRNNAAQVESEFSQWTDVLRREGVRSYLEIGSQYGGALWAAANALPVGSRIVSVDLPQPNQGTDQSLIACDKALKAAGYDVTVFLGDSRSQIMVNQVAALAPFDAIFIDGNHTLPGVTADWENYGPMGRIVAFHDIIWNRPVRPGRLPIEVSKLWREIKGGFRHVEFVASGSEKGIGVLFRC